MLFAYSCNPLQVGLLALLLCLCLAVVALGLFLNLDREHKLVYVPFALGCLYDFSSTVLRIHYCIYDSRLSFLSLALAPRTSDTIFP